MPIPGTKRRRYLEENIGAADLTLTASELAELGRISAGISGARYNERDMAFLGV